MAKPKTTATTDDTTTKDAAAKAETTKDVPAKPGRKAKAELTPELGQTIVTALRAGNFRSTTAKLVGIKPAVLVDWIERGDRGEPGYVDFAEAVARAEARCESTALAKWQAAGENDWRAQERFMAKRFEPWRDQNPYLGRDQVSTIFNIRIHTEPRPDWLAAQQRALATAQEVAVLEVTDLPPVPVKSDSDPDPTLN